MQQTIISRGGGGVDNDRQRTTHAKEHGLGRPQSTITCMAKSRVNRTVFG